MVRQHLFKHFFTNFYFPPTKTRQLISRQLDNYYIIMDQSPFLILSAILGLLIGSFLNVVILRTRAGKGLGGRSQCPGCKAMIRWFDNIPVLSFLWLRGKCRRCRKPISIQYPLVEATSALLFMAVAAVRLGDGSGTTTELALTVARDWCLSAILLVIFVYDVRWYEIPDRFSLSGIAIALAFNLILGFPWQGLAIGVAVGAGFFFIQYVVSRGRWIGSGDIRLGALMGALLGWPLVIVALFIAYIGGSIIALALLAARRAQWQTALPFGAFLAPATWIALLWGHDLWQWYVGLLF